MSHIYSSNTSSLSNIRALSAKLIAKVLDEKKSLSQCLPELADELSPSAKGQLQDYCYGTLRRLPTYSYYLNQLTEQNLSKDLNQIRYLICVGMYQLDNDRVADHAALSETVEACVELGMPKMKGLVNAVLRNFQRQGEELKIKAQGAGLQVNSNHPQWLLSELKKAYPKGFKKILKANLAHPPFWLRANEKVNSLDDFCQKLDQAEIEYTTDKNAILLAQAMPVSQLPDFAQGSCAVQDKAAQQAALLLDAKSGEQVLDACAAPGGKTAHILSHTPDLAKVVALDSDLQRLKRVDENLDRLQLSAEVIVGDASQTNWWDGEAFDLSLIHI